MRGYENEKGKGFPSWAGICFIERNYVIALDSKARLVLPLEVRDALGVRKNEKILFSVSAAKDKCGQGYGNRNIIITVAKAGEENGISCSRNVKYLEEK